MNAVYDSRQGIVSLPGSYPERFSITHQMMAARLELAPNTSGIHQMVPASAGETDLYQLGHWPSLNTDIDPLVVATFHVGEAV